MSSDLLPQDIEVLDKIAKENGYPSWVEMKETQIMVGHNWATQDLINAVVLARLAETARCQKEIKYLLNHSDIGDEYEHDGACWHTALFELKKRLAGE